MDEQLVAFLRARLYEDEKTCEFVARAYREIEAKARIVNYSADLLADDPTARWTLQVLASVYADHPDYRADWRV